MAGENIPKDLINAIGTESSPLENDIEKGAIKRFKEFNQNRRNQKNNQRGAIRSTIDEDFCVLLRKCFIKRN